jgi:hypothetical protein
MDSSSTLFIWASERIRRLLTCAAIPLRNCPGQATTRRTEYPVVGLRFLIGWPGSEIGGDREIRIGTLLKKGAAPLCLKRTDEEVDGALSEIHDDRDRRV